MAHRDKNGPGCRKGLTGWSGDRQSFAERSEKRTGRYRSAIFYLWHIFDQTKWARCFDFDERKGTSFFSRRRSNWRTLSGFPRPATFIDRFLPCPFRRSHGAPYICCTPNVLPALRTSFDRVTRAIGYAFGLISGSDQQVRRAVS